MESTGKINPEKNDGLLNSLLQKTKNCFNKLFPIEAYELKKIIPLLIMFSAIAFCYSALRSMKDAIVLQGKDNTTKNIVIIKAILVLPFAIASKWVYNKLRKRFGDETTFYLILTGFCTFFLMHCIVYPYMQQLRDIREADLIASGAINSTVKLINENGIGYDIINLLYSFFFDIFLSLTIKIDQTLYFIVSELWGSVILSVLFWGFTNKICKMTETKRFYPLLGCSANFATSFTNFVPKVCKKLAGEKIRSNPFDFTIFSLRYYCGIVIFCAIIAALSYKWMVNNVLNDPRLCIQTDEQNINKKKNIPTGKVNVWKDSYLKNIGFMVVAYGIMSQVIEIIYKQQLKNYYVNKFIDESVEAQKHLVREAMGEFNSGVTAWAGRIALILGLVGANSIINHLGWLFAALITPVIMLLTGCLSVGIVAFEGLITGCFGHLIKDLPYLSVVLGGLQISLSKGTKYTLFDSTKEMAYLPLDQETKAAAKAEIDLVGARFGKAGGSVYNIIMMNFIFTKNILEIAPCSLCVVAVLGSYWIYSVKSLGNQFTSLAKLKEEQEEIAFQKQTIK